MLTTRDTPDVESHYNKRHISLFFALVATKSVQIMKDKGQNSFFIQKLRVNHFTPNQWFSRVK